MDPHPTCRQYIAFMTDFAEQPYAVQVSRGQARVPATCCAGHAGKGPALLWHGGNAGGGRTGSCCALQHLGPPPNSLGLQQVQRKFKTSQASTPRPPPHPHPNTLTTMQAAAFWAIERAYNEAWASHSPMKASLACK